MGKSSSLRCSFFSPPLPVALVSFMSSHCLRPSPSTCLLVPSYNMYDVDRLPHGKGTYKFANGNLYKGEFENGQFHGKGEMHYPGYGMVVNEYC